MKIILGVIAFFALILSIKISLNFVYEDRLLIYLRILFIKIPLYPAKKKRFNQKKQEKKKKKKASRPTHILKDNAEVQKPKPSLLDNINIVREVLEVFLKAFPKHLHVRLAKIHIKVASGDAAQTAILYGAVSGAVSVIVDMLGQITNLDRIRSSSISVEPDFLSEKTECKLNISLSLRVWGATTVLAKTLWRYAKRKFRK